MIENINTNLIKNSFPFVTKEQLRLLNTLPPLYKEWNNKINVISRKDIDNIFIHHILHSLSIAKVLCFKDGTRVLDVGTGGGFPGIPLAIMFPQANFHLIDRIAKKIKVVNAIKEELNLNNVVAEQLPCEEDKQKYDFIISRAVTNMTDFLKITKGRLSDKNFNEMKNGILYLKGDDVEKELVNYKGKYTLYNINDFFCEEFFSTKRIVYIPTK